MRDAMRKGRLKNVHPLRRNEAVSSRVPRMKTVKEFCVNGHRLNIENLYICPKGNPYCRECSRISMRKSYRSKHGIT